MIVPLRRNKRRKERLPVNPSLTEIIESLDIFEARKASVLAKRCVKVADLYMRMAGNTDETLLDLAAQYFDRRIYWQDKAEESFQRINPRWKSVRRRILTAARKDMVRVTLHDNDYLLKDVANSA